MRSLFFISLISLGLFSCSKQSVKSIELSAIELTADGPYFEGPNSFQAVLSNTLKNNGIAAENVDKVELTKASIVLPDSIESGLIQDFSLQLLSNSSKIKKVAFINPLVQGQKVVNLTIAQEQEEIADIFSKEEFIVLVDANFSKDIDASMSFKTNLTFKITSH